MSTHEERLRALREEMGAAGLDGFLVPLTDEHGSEYVGAYAQRLAWLTGFSGSAGSAVVLKDRAALFVDGRYTLQARAQVDPGLFALTPVHETPVAQWLGANVREAMRIGYDPWLHTHAQVAALSEAVAARGAELVAVETNPIDRAWAERPAMSDAPLGVHPERLAGRSAAAKRAEIAEWLEQQGADTVVLTALDGIAWAFNVRGQDVEHTPVGLAFALLHREGTADLFVDEAKLTPQVREHLGNAVKVRPREAFAGALGELHGRAVVADPGATAEAVFRALGRAGARVVARRDPVVLAKAVKNRAEVAGARSAHLRDGVAVTRFLHWLEREAPGGGVDELGAAARLEAFRRESGAMRDLSFPSIVGAGPNGAIIHYRVSEATNRRLERGSLFLIDSGAQYEDGTTDVTRTVAVGEPTAEMRDRFTRVLKGHIGVASAVFPKGTKGCQLDGFARRALWEAGLDYAHGTGHGVGSYLAVHEGPARIASYGGGDEPLLAGMILSNEPGYYKVGEYGIRIENLVLVAPREVAGAEREMLGFETLTLAPIDLRLVDWTVLSEGERGWLETYHARVRDELGPQLPDDVRAWVEEVTRAG